MENVLLRERLVGKNGWQQYVYQAAECVLHGTYVRATGIELYNTEMILPPQHSFKLHACSEYLKPTLLFTYS